MKLILEFLTGERPSLDDIDEIVAAAEAGQVFRTDIDQKTAEGTHGHLSWTTVNIDDDEHPLVQKALERALQRRMQRWHGRRHW